MKKDLKSTTMKTIKGVLDGMLKSEANSTSCMLCISQRHRKS